MTDSIETEIRDRLSDVMDPCSCYTSDPVSVVDLGIVEDVSFDGGEVTVNLVLTSPSCMYFLQMANEIENRVGAIEEVDSVSVTREDSKYWHPSMMDEDVRTKRYADFVDSMEQSGIEPKFD